MKIETSYQFNAPPERVWRVLMAPDTLRECIPGCEKLEPAGDNRYRATMKLSVGPVKGSFQGIVQLADLEPPQSYRLIVEGGGGPGFVKAESSVRLEPQGTVTLVTVTGDAQVGGAIATVGQRLLGGVTKRLMDSFFTCLQSRV